MSQKLDHAPPLEVDFIHCTSSGNITTKSVIDRMKIFVTLTAPLVYRHFQTHTQYKSVFTVQYMCMHFVLQFLRNLVIFSVLLQEGNMAGAYLGDDGRVHIPGKKVTLYSEPSPPKPVPVIKRYKPLERENETDK